MSHHLVLSFRFLSSWFHGRRDEGTPEWPPSPLRAFQALVAASARAGSLAATRDALTWLERLPPPTIIASEAIESNVGYRLSVPHNATDLVAMQWSRGDDHSSAEHRTMKSLRPHRLPDDGVVHYSWQLEGQVSTARELIAAARGVVALGWGIDLVVGDGEIVGSEKLAELSAKLRTWEACSDSRQGLRVQTKGTLQDIERRYAAFLNRTGVGDFTIRPAPPLSTFLIINYARADAPRHPECAGFTLMRVDSDSFRAFDSARRGMAVAGMLRHAVRVAAERAGWDKSRVNASVLGHGTGGEPRLLLVPVPSIEPRGAMSETVGAVRRVLVLSTNVGSNDAAWANRALGGVDLVDESTGEVQAVLAITNSSDRVLSRYTTESRTWVTVTPIVLPGHDDPGGLRAKLRKASGSLQQKALLGRLMKRRELLVRKALRHAGLGDELAFSAKIKTRETGFLAGVEKASRYAVPSHLVNWPRLHVKLTWPERVAGPLCIGRGRFSGLGLFAAVPDASPRHNLSARDEAAVWR